jgi:DNA-binding LacI/PurR family transcriptional regulator
MNTPEITVKDIASKLRISPSTVSRALNGHEDVSPETKDKVMEMARQLNYSPNHAARSLRTHRTRTLGLVVPEISKHFFSNVLSGIQEYASSLNYSIVISQSLESFSMEQNHLQQLVSARADGILISLSNETNHGEHLRKLLDRDIPIVMFDRVLEDLPVSKVVVDDQKASFQAVEYLIKTGCKRIAFIGGLTGLYVSKEREAGYRQALTMHGLPIDEELIVHCNNLNRSPREEVTKLLQRTNKLDAIFCLNDPIAIEVMQVVKEWNLKIPEDISLIGFTNEPTSYYIEPSLTTVSQPAYEMGKTAVSLLIEQLENPKTFQPSTVVLGTRFIIRNTTRKLL